MNILPKKRWHVRTKDNIARVRRDEAKAAAEEKAAQQRAQLAEQEARTNFLRQQAAKGRGEDEFVPNAVVVQEPNKHINFFSEAADGQKSWGTSKEREAEKKEEQEKYEKNIGYLTYLGQSSLDTKGSKPWYEKPHSLRFDNDDKNSQVEVGKKVKNLLDPLKNMQKYLELSGKKPEEVDKPNSSKSSEKKKTDEKAIKAHKKHKSKKKKKRRHSNDSSSDDEEEEKAKKLQKLRAERLKREMEEKKRSEKLLAKLRGESNDLEKQSTAPVRDGDQGYNSQFNPHLAKKPKTDNNKF